jgi:hypothetical protein
MSVAVKRVGENLVLYCSQPCATFGPYIFTTKPAGGMAVAGGLGRRLRSNFPRTHRAGAVGTTIAPSRREKLFPWGQHLRALNFGADFKRD